MNELEALVILSQVPYLGSVKLKLLIDYFGSSIKALDAEKEEIESLPGFGARIASHWKQWQNDPRYYEELELIDRHKVKIISYKCPDYPKRLLELSDSPLLLYVKGTLKKEDARSIAIVGTRTATRYGLNMTEKISKEISSLGFTIVSGLARGVDTIAHKTAVDQKSRTIAVIGSGLLNIYPRENSSLAEKIADNGALISEFAMKTPPEKHNFPRRNRIVSGMTLATTLIEAPLDSGAMITMQKAFEQKRRLFAIPGPLDFPSFAGNHKLIKTGEAKLIETGFDIAAPFEDLLGSYHPPVLKKEGIFLEKEEEMFLKNIPIKELSFDEIAALTKLPAMQLNVLLMGLVLKRAIKEYPGKIYKKVF